MTNFDFNDIIKRLIFSISKNEDIKFSVEVNADNFKELVFPHCKQKCACSKIRMQSSIVELKEITYYLIQLFYRTGKKYSCTQTKLGKMLSILAFKYAKNNNKLFDVPIYKYPPHCGTLIKDLTFIPKDIYERSFDKGNPDATAIINDTFDDVQIPSPYNEFSSLSLKVKADIEDLFINFGAYPADELGKLLNPIVDQIVNQENDELILSNLLNLDRNAFNKGQDGNAIVDYIYQ